MNSEGGDELRGRLAARIGLPLSGSGRSEAPDAVNLPMIRHWIDAFDDRNPAYLSESAALDQPSGSILAPPAMLQSWTMGRPQIEGIAERGGSAGEMQADNPLTMLTSAGFGGTLATNSELEFERYLQIGDRLVSSTVLETVSEIKATGLGDGYFVTWVTDYRDGEGTLVGRQRFRVLKFAPGRREVERSGASRAEKRSEDVGGEELPPWELEVTPTVIVAGAIASRDFMPVHHDRDYAQAQGAPDIFMNILSTNGYVARYVTDWAGCEARLKRISIRLGGPAVPGLTLRFSGRVIEDSASDLGRELEVAVKAANELGDHATGTVSLVLAEGSN